MPHLIHPLRLDTVPPPTWDGVNPEEGNPYIDDNTKLRPTNGDDDFHYETYQRSQGDLFARDLYLNQRLNLIGSYLASGRGVLNFPIPSLRVEAGKSETISTLDVPSNSAVVIASVVVNAVHILEGSISSISISGDLTSDGSAPVVFPDLLPIDGQDGWSVDGDGSTLPYLRRRLDPFGSPFDPDEWELKDSATTAAWRAPFTDGISPMGLTFTPQGLATGTPVFSERPLRLEVQKISDNSVLASYENGTNLWIDTSAVSFDGFDSEAVKIVLVNASTEPAVFNGQFVTAIVSTGAAYTVLDPDGDDNLVLVTAVDIGFAGNSITVEILTPADQVTTDVAVVENAITITPGDEAQMVVAGTLTSDGSIPLVFGSLPYLGMTNGKVSYGDGVNTLISYDGSGSWFLQDLTSGASWEGFDYAYASPTEVDTWSPVGSETGAPTVVAAASSAGQVIAAINGSVDASILVLASANGPSTGAVAAVAAVNLGGGAG